MRVGAHSLPPPAQPSQGPQRLRRTNVDPTGASKAALVPASSTSRYQLSVSVSTLMQSARSGDVSAEQFDQRLSDIAQQLLSPDMSAAEKGRAIHLVARMAGLENQLVERLQGNRGGQPNTIDQQIGDWAGRFAEAIGVTLQGSSGNSPGALLERKL